MPFPGMPGMSIDGCHCEVELVSRNSFGVIPYREDAYIVCSSPLMIDGDMTVRGVQSVPQSICFRGIGITPRCVPGERNICSG